MASERMDYSSNPSGYYMYCQFNIHKFYVRPTQCICVLCGSENKQRLFPYAASTGGLCNQDSVYCATEYSSAIHVNINI
jgi:hypothetical protein